MKTVTKQYVLTILSIAIQISTTHIYPMNKQGPIHQAEKYERSITDSEMAYNAHVILEQPTRDKKIKVFNNIITYYGNVDAKDSQGNTLLMKMAEAGDLELVTLLLNKGANPDNVAGNGETPLLLASKEGNAEVVKLLLDNNAHIDATRCDGVTPLMLASGYGHIHAAKLLLDRDADIHAYDAWGNTALTWAACYDYTGIVQLLIFAGLTYKEIPDVHGNNPWYKHHPLKPTMLMAINEAQRAKNDLGAQDWSLEKLSQSNIFNELAIPQSIAHIIIALCDPHTENPAINRLIDQEIVKKEHEVIARAERTHLGLSNLLNSPGLQSFSSFPIKTDSTEKTNKQKTLLASFSSNQLDSFTQLLLSAPTIHEQSELLDEAIARYGTIDARSENGFTLLINIAFYGTIESATILIDRKADINAATHVGITPLIAASIKNKTDMITMLLDKGADLYAQNINGNTALAFAAMHEQEEAVKLLTLSGLRYDAKEHRKNHPHPLSPKILKIINEIQQEKAYLDAQN